MINTSTRDEKISPEALLKQGKIIQIPTHGNSMTPFLISGRDEAVIEPADVSSARRGDVVLYRRKGGRLVLHRIYKIKGQSFYAIGDSQTQVEGPIQQDAIIGKLSAIVKNGKLRPVGTGMDRFLSDIWLYLRPIRPILFRIGHYLKKYLKK